MERKFVKALTLLLVIAIFSLTLYGILLTFKHFDEITKEMDQQDNESIPANLSSVEQSNKNIEGGSNYTNVSLISSRLLLFFLNNIFFKKHIEVNPLLDQIARKLQGKILSKISCSTCETSSSRLLIK